MHQNKRTDPAVGQLATLLILILSAVFTHGVASAQETPDQETPDQATIEALMAKSLELAQPGPEHARFERMAGTWDMEMTMWSQPGAEAVVVSGVVEAELILGGRYLVQTTVIPDGFFAGESITILGFDRRSEEYTLIGLDTVGTYWVSAQGPATSGTEAVLSGEDFDPVFGHLQEYDFVLRWEEDGAFVSQIIFKDAAHTGGGEPFKMIEIVSRPRQASGE